MKLSSCVASNFGSYPYLEFDFKNVGLGLIQGKTGSGKSTIPDVVCWCLYGQTAKVGLSDEVRSWQSPNEPTHVSLVVDLPGGTITVERTRGKPSENDLYWLEGQESKERRGKDLSETQKLLNKRLGVDAELFLAGSYFHEFSTSGNFFNAKAKERRELFEGIADMSLAVRVSDSSSKGRKSVKAIILSETSKAERTKGRAEQLKSSILASRGSSIQWDTNQILHIIDLENKEKYFQKDLEEKIKEVEVKAAAWTVDNERRVETKLEQVETLSSKLLDTRKIDLEIVDTRHKIEHLKGSKCSKCGNPDAADSISDLSEHLNSLKNKVNSVLQAEKDVDRLMEEINRLQREENPFSKQVSTLKSQENTYAEQVKSAKSERNPFLDQISSSEREYERSEAEIRENSKLIEKLEGKVSKLNILYDLSFELRGELLKKAVKEIETSTNHYLETYFDAEIRVKFEIEGADDLTVSINKSGYDCVFRQLSKGQRGLLKLCFVRSIMKASSNKAGIHFESIFLDEALDGLDSDLKIKAFRMLEELSTEHSTVLVIDHAPEFQNLFEKRYFVTMDGDASKIELDE